MIKRQALFVKKIDFAKDRLKELSEYDSSTIADLAEDRKILKYIEKTIQELVDCLIDINEIVLEDEYSESRISGKQSFRKLNNHNKLLAEDDLNTMLDLVSFRNEIVHSYDVNTYIIWSKRTVSVISVLAKKYLIGIFDLYTSATSL